ncbi:MAG: RNA 2',3'-cyclic phosphodiesterase [Pseudomonadota bacterium]|nr:RNA 2',3'-cyclic phosphodiesterase [Pseudomonadota bacterium]
MTRCFIALGIPPDIRTHFTLLYGGIPGARWTPEDNLHLTLRFLGPLDNSVLEDVAAALSLVDCPAFTLTFRGVGQFGDRKIHSLWAGVEDSPGLQLLHGKIAGATRRAGIPPDERKFTPHVTLARLKNAPEDRILRFLSGNSLFRTTPVLFDHFTLYASHTGESGSVYEPLQDFPLVQ